MGEGGPMFNPSCWKYAMVEDLWSNLSAQEQAYLDSSNPMWLQLSPHTMLAKIVWSREACTLLHPQSHQQPPPVWHAMETHLGISYSMSRLGSDLSIIDIDDGLGDQVLGKTTPASTTEALRETMPAPYVPSSGGLENLESDSDTDTAEEPEN